MTVSLAALLLAAAFGWAAAAKVTRLPAWRIALAGYRLPEGLERVVFAGVPVVEVVVVALLVAGGDAGSAGAALAVALLGAFSIAVLRARRLQGDRLPCGCFGGSGDRDYRAMLVRNALLGVLAALALVAPDLVTISAPRSSQAVPVALAAAGLALVVWLAIAAGRAVRG